LSKFAPLIGSDRKIDGECGDFFPILALPTELISLVFSFLSMRDRLIARVKKRLDIIELESKYYVDLLIIEEESTINEWMMQMKDAVDDDDDDNDE
ncbi:hypothetical protein PENTCL1PPCAC_10993, partial [Pristionchus entomophagus]